MEWHLFQFDSQYMITVAVRIMAACLLGGIIGFEREFSHHKPAGFRTHILVSLGACLVMLISQFAISSYEGTANVDPTRLGAQVISGIGFLGAGAIIRHGVSVKGITTAASIWAVACVGLACGIGFYSAAVLSTLIIWAVLMYLKTIEQKLQKENLLNITIEAQFEVSDASLIENELKVMGIKIMNIDASKNERIINQRMSCQALHPLKSVNLDELVKKIMHIKGVVRVTL